ncbi:MAG TPA: relaxase domain-containing protein, partial [Actinomycetes bacterium]|nr:relaxase domain-containing protein [Actinomycetes bacterium]
MCPDRDCWRSGSTTGRPEKATRCCTPSGGGEPRPGAGRPLDGRDLYRHRLAADAIYRATYQRELARTLGVEWTAEDTHGNRELHGMPEALVRGFSKRTDQIDAELDRLTGDGRERTPRAGQVDRPRHPQGQAARAPGLLVRPLAGRAGRARRRSGHPGP